MSIYFSCGANISRLDNFSIIIDNIENFVKDDNFTLIEGDIRDINTCQIACKNQEFVLHQAALGSVPIFKRSQLP